MQRSIKATVFRGGTSRGLFFHASELPPDRDLQSQILLAAMGSPDPLGRQVDGLGGGSSVTNKAAIIAPTERPDADVDYTFAQVAVDRPLVDWRGNCGNISSAVGPFAVDELLVPSTPPETIVRIFNTNTNRLIAAHVPTSKTGVISEGDYEIPGVQGAGAPIFMEFLDPGGSVTGKLLPTGRTSQTIKLPELSTEVEVSIVDAANPFVFVALEDVTTVDEVLSAFVGSNALPLLARLEAVRAAAAVETGLAETADEATRLSPSVPKLGLIGPGSLHTQLCVTSNRLRPADVTVVATTMGQLHSSFQLTGAVCAAIASRLPGTIVHHYAAPTAQQRDDGNLRIGHRAGVTEVAGHVAQAEDGSWRATRAGVTRTARRIMDGSILIPSRVWP